MIMIPEITANIITIGSFAFLCAALVYKEFLLYRVYEKALGLSWVSTARVDTPGPPEVPQAIPSRAPSVAPPPKVLSPSPPPPSPPTDPHSRTRLSHPSFPNVQTGDCSSDEEKRSSVKAWLAETSSLPQHDPAQSSTRHAILDARERNERQRENIKIVTETCSKLREINLRLRGKGRMPVPGQPQSLSSKSSQIGDNDDPEQFTERRRKVLNRGYDFSGASGHVAGSASDQASSYVTAED